MASYTETFSPVMERDDHDARRRQELSEGHASRWMDEGEVGANQPDLRRDC